MTIVSKSVETRDWEATLNLALAIRNYLARRGHWTGRITAIEAGLTAARELGHRRREVISLESLGRVYRDLGEVDRALSLDPGDVRAIDTRAHVLAALGRQSEALAEFERAMQAGGADWVRTYQEALAKHGYYPGAIYGGGYRPQTQAALVACLDAGCRLLE